MIFQKIKFNFLFNDLEFKTPQENILQAQVHNAVYFNAPHKKNLIISSMKRRKSEFFINV